MICGSWLGQGVAALLAPVAGTLTIGVQRWQRCSAGRALLHEERRGCRRGDELGAGRWERGTGRGRILRSGRFIGQGAVVVGIVFEEIVQGYAAKITGRKGLSFIRRTDRTTGFATRAFDGEWGFFGKSDWGGRSRIAL